MNAIAPGVFRTELNAQLLDSTPRGQELLMRTPMGRFGKTEELVGAAIYLASDAASFVTGQTLVSMAAFSPAASTSSYSRQCESPLTVKMDLKHRPFTFGDIVCLIQFVISA